MFISSGGAGNETRILQAGAACTRSNRLPDLWTSARNTNGNRRGYLRNLWRAAMGNHAADLADHFKAKPAHKNTFIFKASDIYPPKRKGHHLDAESIRKRKSLGTWLHQHMQPIASIAGFDITIYMAVHPYRYIATRKTES